MKPQHSFLNVLTGSLVLLCSMILLAEPMSTAFTYQGRLLDDNIAADGVYDFEFTLHYSDPNGLPGIQVITPFDDVQVTDGYFTVELDLESSFNGDARWLEIAVRPGESTDPGDYETLSPPREITSTPYTLYALRTRGISVDDDLNVGIGTLSPTEMLDVAGTVKAAAFVGDGSGLSNLPGTSLWRPNGPDIYYNVGNVGIGTDSPSSKLDIGRTSDTANSIRIASASTGQASIVFYDAESTACGGMEYFHTNNSLAFVTQNSGGGSSIKMAIDSDGNVGIGTEYPLSKLQVAGTVHSTTGGFKFPDGTTQTTASNSDGHSLDAADGDPVDALYVDDDGMVGIGNQDPYFRLDVGDTTDSNNYLRIASQDWGGVVFYDGEDLTSGGIKYSHSADSLQFETRDYGGSSSTKMVVKAGGNVGIGTVNPTTLLEVAGTVKADNIGIGTSTPEHAVDVYGDQIRLTENSTGHSMAMRTDGTVLDFSYEGASLVIQGGADDEHVLFNTNSGRDCRVGIRTWSPTRRFFVNGDAGGTTAWYNDSDARLKKDVVTIDNALEKVGQLRGVQFEWKNPEDHVEGKQIGFIGQETVDAVPEVVDVKNGQYSMQYAPLTALLVEAVKEQQKQIEALRAEIENLKNNIRE